MFAKSLLWWLLVNLLLGPDADSTSAQLTYLGTCMTGDALEWFSQNVEDHWRPIHDWTIESVLVGLQSHFLHLLTHRHASMCFDAMHQGNSTVQDLLNRLTKHVACMVVVPDKYTLWKCFIAVLRDALRQEVLTKGLTAEFSSLEELTTMATAIENAVHYNLSMWQLELHGGGNTTSYRPLPPGARVIATNRPQFLQGTQPKLVAGQGPPQANPVRPSAYKSGPNQHPPAVDSTIIQYELVVQSPSTMSRSVSYSVIWHTESIPKSQPNTHKGVSQVAKVVT